MWPMARLRWPVARSDSNTASSISSGRPAYAESTSSTRASRSCAVGPGDQRGGGDRAGVDHRVQRRPVPGSRLIELNASPDGSTPIVAQHLLAAAVLERHAVDQRLGDRLDREGLARVADLVDLAVDRRHDDAEPGRVGLRQFGDVGRDLAGGQRGEAGVQLLEVGLDGRGGAGRSGGIHCRAWSNFRARGLDSARCPTAPAWGEAPRIGACGDEAARDGRRTLPVPAAMPGDCRKPTARCRDCLHLRQSGAAAPWRPGAGLPGRRCMFARRILSWTARFLLSLMRARFLRHWSLN